MGKREDIMEESVIELKNLQVTFGKRVILSHLNAVVSGHCIGLLGPNGAGKTTLIRTLLGFIRPSSGSFSLFNGKINPGDLSFKELIGYMPEEDSLIPSFTAVRFVRLMAELSGLPPSDAMERAHESLFLVGLGEARYRKLESFSRGMKQRIKIAQAIVHSPRLLLFDEPTDGFDPAGRVEILSLIRDIVQRRICSVILSTHLLSDVEELCDHVIILNRGEIVLDRSLRDLKKSDTPVLELRVRGDEIAFMNALQDKNILCSIGRNKKLRLNLNEGTTIGDIYGIAQKHDIRILQLIPQRDSLEEVFFRVLEKVNGRL